MVRGRYDVVVVGGGHNGLTAAAYLSRAGLSVLVLERLGQVGGAAVSARAFPDFPTRLSRYSYLVSLLPDQIRTDLDLDIELATRWTASYTPYLRDKRPGGLLVESPEGERTRQSFAALTGDEEDYTAWRTFYGEVGTLAKVVAPTLTQPLPTDRDVRAQVDPTLWHDLVERPLGEAIERRFGHDLVRGVVATDALIGTFASLHDRSLVQNRCFLYHLVGNGTGEWRVPIGGMGAVTGALARAAHDGGAEVVTSARVSAIRGGAAGAGAEVCFESAEGEQTVACDYVLAGVAPWTLGQLLGEPEDGVRKPVGSQLKINILLERLPRLLSGERPELAFAGTLHLGESMTRLEQAYAEAASGSVPTDLPGEVYCHSLTDPSILGDVPSGTHTLTYFGLHTPATLFDDPATRAARKAEAVERAITSLDNHLLDPIASVVVRDAEGEPCIEAKIPQDIEDDLGMPGGHIFHGDLDWPWASHRSRLPGAADRWGVATELGSVLLCGSGARRGGAVSGLGGHNAAQAVLELR